jgi:hypothetical protein
MNIGHDMRLSVAVTYPESFILFFWGGGGLDKLSRGQRAERTGSGGGSPLVRGSAIFANELNPFY